MIKVDFIIIAIVWGAIIAMLWACFDGLILSKTVIYQRYKPLRVCIRAFFCIIPALSAHILCKNWLFSALIYAVSGFVFAICFDPVLNIVRARPWNYRGTESFTDETFQHKPVTQLALYLLGLVVSIIITTQINFT